MTALGPRRLLLAAFCTVSLISGVSAYPRGKTYHVSSTGSIQDAVALASPGDKIIVDGGVHLEQIEITKNGITLLGKNATIQPPSTYKTNSCTDLVTPGTQAGICIAGAGIAYIDEPFNGDHRRVQSVTTLVKDTRIEGFTVSGFSGLNIAVLGAQDAVISENTVFGAPHYGILTVASKGTNIRHNLVQPGYYIGICMDDKSDVEVQHNEVGGYIIGLCVQTNGANIHDNSVHDVCFGAFVDPLVKGASLRDNTFTNTGAGCDYGAGVYISGAIGTIVRTNTFSGIKNPTGISNAVAIAKGYQNGEPATGNDVEKNAFSDNDLDVAVDPSGTGNVVKKNKCSAKPGSCQ